MATRPTIYAEWATSLITEVKDTEGDGNLVAVDNKVEPTAEWKNSGQLFQENMPYPYINWDLDLLDQWVKHLDQRYSVGDVHLTASGENAATISIRLGGTWVDRGSDTLAGQTYEVFEKTV